MENSKDGKDLKNEIPIPGSTLKTKAPKSQFDKWQEEKHIQKIVKNLHLQRIVKKTETVFQNHREQITGPKIIREIKATCVACGNVWYFGKSDVFEKGVADTFDSFKTMLCCQGCLPALFMPDRKAVDPNRCPKCGSRAINTEVVIHEIR